MGYLDLTSVLFISPRGSTIPLTLYEDLKPYFPNLAAIFQAYAMSEVLMAMSLSFNAKIALGAVGSDVMIKLVDPDTGENCDTDQVGEIMVKAATAVDGIMKGYLNRPEENEKFFADDGFVHTGYLASYQKNGCLIFEGRSKELIKYKNYHLYPLEIENVI